MRNFCATRPKPSCINPVIMINLGMRRHLKNLALLSGLCACFLMAQPTSAQQTDLAFGLSTISAPSASSASGQYSPQSLTGGAYPSFSGDFLIKKHLGVSSEVAWRGGRSFYQGVYPFRPVLWDINGIWAPPLGKNFVAEFMAGIGGENIRFYQPFTFCGFTGCTNYVSSNHFMGHIGGGIRAYLFGNFFIRPEAHLYLIHNNFEFSSGRATRFGVSIGYSFRPPAY